MPLQDHPEFDSANPHALIHLLPDWLQQLCSTINEADVDKTDEELTAEIFGADGISATLYRLRIAFWDEYDRAVRYEEKAMDIGSVYHGTCSLIRFRKELSDPRKLAWLFKPPTGYTLILKEISELALKRQLEVMRMPPVDSKGRPNVKLIEAQMKIFQHVDVRLKGAVVQKIEQKNLNVNVDGPKGLQAGKTPLSLAEVDSEIARLRDVSEKLRAPATAVLDVQKMITGEIMGAEVIRETPAKTPVHSAAVASTEAEPSP